MESIKNIADAMSWLSTTSEITNREILFRAMEARTEICGKLLKENPEIGLHFIKLSQSIIDRIGKNL